MNVIQSGILRAVAYADGFEFGLTKSELVSRFVGKKKVEREKIEEGLERLVLENRLETEGEMIFFPGRREVARQRKSRLGPTTKKYVMAKKMADFLGKIPLVQGVFLTGTVAADNAEAKDDIDLMVISKAGWLWTTRLIVTILVELMGKRRRPEQEEVMDSFCINLYLDEAEMAVPEKMRSLYTAHEVILAKCLFEREKIADRFLWKNRWVRDYLPNWEMRPAKEKVGKRQKHWLETRLFRLQKAYMSARITKELVTEKSAFFHPSNTRSVVINNYLQRLRQYGIEE